MEHLNRFLITIRQSFPINWGNQYNFQEEILPDLESVLSEFKDKAARVHEELFEHLNKSVLSGEYVLYGFEDAIKQSNRELESILFMASNEDVQRALKEIILDNFTVCFQLVLRKYLSLHLRVRNRYHFDDRRFIHEYDSEISRMHEQNIFFKTSITSINFFTANVVVAEMDHFLLPDIADFRLLLKLTKSNDLQENKFYPILIDKCHFLIIKWSLRQEHIQKQPVFAILNDTEKRISKEEFSSDIYSVWKNYIKNHYEFNDWKATIKTIFNTNRVKLNNIKKLTLQDLHLCIKYYKDVNVSRENIKIIRCEISNQYEDIKSREFAHSIDLYAYSIALIYAYNNEFSLLVSDPNAKEDQIDGLYNEIHALEISTGVRNFFIQFKYVGYLSDKLAELYEQRKALDFIKPARQIIDKCEQMFSDYSNNVEWSESNYNYVFQLPYSECLVDYNSQHIQKIFIASSFLLPLSKDKYKKEFEEHRYKVLVLKSTIDVLENIETDIVEFDTMKDEVKSNQARALEIIGVFTALVTFLFSSVQAFQFLKTTSDVLLFMLTLSTSLCFFAILLLTITRGFDVIRKYWDVVILFLGLAFFFWILATTWL